MIKDTNLCFCALCCCCRCFPGGFEESLAAPGTAGGLRRGEGLACCPLPPGKPWHLLPRLSCQPFSAPLPALATGDVISMVTTSGALGHLGPEGATKGRLSMPVSPSQGPTQARVLRLLIEILAAEHGGSWSSWEQLGPVSLWLLFLLHSLLVARPPVPSPVQRSQCLRRNIRYLCIGVFGNMREFVMPLARCLEANEYSVSLYYLLFEMGKLRPRSHPQDPSRHQPYSGSIFFPWLILLSFPQSKHICLFTDFRALLNSWWFLSDKWIHSERSSPSWRLFRGLYITGVGMP